jgi:glycosyltransferase involved in cell wall biosynthesis
MNLLLINHYAGSPVHGMEFRPWLLAREWVRSGHQVQILAADHSHVRATQPDLAGAAVRDESIDGIAYRWYRTPRYAGNGLGRVRNIAAFLHAVWADTPRLLRDFAPDAVIASSTYPLDIWPARRLARRAGATLVHEVHDVWPLSPIELSGMSRWHPWALLCQWAEDTACRDADRVVSMLPKVHDHLAAHGLDLRRLHIVPNGVAPEDWQGEPPPLRADVQAELDAARAAGAAVVVYAGSMGEPNALDTLLDAMALLHRRPGAPAIRLVMVGDGHERMRLVARIDSEPLPNTRWLPPIPKAQVRSLLAQGDVAYLGWQRVSLYRFGIAPNKLMDYMMAGCAVLHSVDAGNDPVQDAGCGLSVPPGDAAAVADGLSRLASLPTTERRAMGDRGRAFVIQHHTWPVLAARFLEALR